MIGLLQQMIQMIFIWLHANTVIKEWKGSGINCAEQARACSYQLASKLEKRGILKETFNYSKDIVFETVQVIEEKDFSRTVYTIRVFCFTKIGKTKDDCKFDLYNAEVGIYYQATKEKPYCSSVMKLEKESTVDFGKFGKEKVFLSIKLPERIKIALIRHAQECEVNKTANINRY